MISTRANILTRRSYNRPLNDEGTVFETWEETIDRVIEHQRWLWERALTHKVLPGMPLRDITEDMLEWVHLNSKQWSELAELRALMLERKTLPSGRTLWLGGTDIAKTRESSMFNCSHSTLETVYDAVDLFWLLLQGCGIGVTPVVGNLTGFRSTIPEIQVIRSKKGPYDKGRPTNEETLHNGVWTIQVGDSAEAWAKSLGKLLVGKTKAKKIVFDFSEIRGSGGRLKGYGWISSGDESISKAYPAIAEIMNKRAGSLLRKIDIIEIVNWLGTVLSSRRSAEITFVDYGTDEWEEFARFKKDCYQDGKKHKQQSNNSLVFNTKPTKDQLTEIFDMMIAAGGSEPGLYNMESGRKRAPFARGSNPCGEILLPSKGFCNLVEVDLNKFHGDAAGLHRAYTLIARANYRQTCVDLEDGILQESWNTNNKFLRLCGVGATGIATRDDLTEYDIKKLRDSAVFAARSMAKELGTEYPKNVTTVKPSGTLGKIMDTTEGIHKPEGKYLFNWVNFSNHDPIVMKLKEANYKWVPNPGDSTSTLICLPVESNHVEFTRKELKRKDGTIDILDVNLESAITQLERYKKWQLFYCDQNVSNTIYYKPEEKDAIVDWLWNNWDVYVGVSFLFKNDPTVSAKDLGFNYLPQEYVTKERFEEYTNSLLEVKWEGTDADIEVDDGGCATGACPIR